MKHTVRCFPGTVVTRALAPGVMTLLLMASLAHGAESLQRAGQTIAASWSTEGSDGAPLETFDFLRDQLRRWPQLTSLSIWDASGWPIAWAGPVSLQPPVSGEPAATAARLRWWLPLPQGHRLLVEAPAVPRQEPGSGFMHSADLPWSHLLGLTAVGLLALFATRRSGGRQAVAIALVSGLIWLLHAWAMWLCHSGKLPLHPDLSSSTLYATRWPLDLYRSPAAAALSGLALTCQALLLLRLFSPLLHRSRVRLGLLMTGLAGLITSLLLTARAGIDSNLDLVGLTSGTWAAPHMAVQWGLLLSMAAPATLFIAASWPPGRKHPVLHTLLFSPLLAAALFAAFTWSSDSSRRQLVEENLRPLLSDQVADREQALADSMLQLKEAAAALGPAPEDDIGGQQTGALAYQLWQGTALARAGYHSSLEIYDPTGRLVGSFAYAMPPPVPALSGTFDPGETVAMERLVFATLSQQQEVMASRMPVLNGEGQVVAAIALYVADHWENVPFLLEAQEPFPWTPGHSRTLDLLRGPPLVSVHDAGGQLLWSAQPDPVPWAAGYTPAGESSGWTEAVSAGRRVNLFHFQAGDDFYSLGYYLESWTQILARLLRFVLLQCAFLAGLLAAGNLALRPFPVLRQEAWSLARWFVSSWGRKLAAAMVLASMVPFLGLALLLRAPLERQRQDSLNTLALQSLEVARRVVRDAMVAGAGEGTENLPSDETLYWLSRVIRQDIDLFLEDELMATSRRGLVAAGLVSPLPDAGAFRDIVLTGKQVSLPDASASAGGSTVSAALEHSGPGAAILRLPFRRQEAAIARAGAEVRQRADLATAAVTLLLLLAAVLVGRGTTGRLRRLSAATDRLATGESAVTVPVAGRDELGHLTASFNTMSRSLARQRADLQSRTRTLENLVTHAPIGIIHMDHGNHLLMLNPAARRLTGGSGVAGTPFPAAIADSPYRQGLQSLVDAARQAPGVARTRELGLDAGGDTRLRAVVVELSAQQGDRLLILEDITESLRSSRLAAWADMARRIAHEIKNPLTPMRLAAEHLLRVHRSGDPRYGATLERTVRTILSQVAALRDIASDFSLYARLPEKKLQELDVAGLLNEVLAPYRDSPPANLEFTVHWDADLPEVRADPALLSRAVVNLVENALQAMPSGGRLTVAAAGQPEHVLITVQDTGTGMDAATLSRIFEPYFSTRDAGTGLGLAIARRTVEEQGGTLTASSREGHGTTFSLTLPLANRSHSHRLK